MMCDGDNDVGDGDNNVGDGDNNAGDGGDGDCDVGDGDNDAGDGDKDVGDGDDNVLPLAIALYWFCTCALIARIGKSNTAYQMLDTATNDKSPNMPNSCAKRIFNENGNCSSMPNTSFPKRLMSLPKG